MPVFSTSAPAGSTPATGGAPADSLAWREKLDVAGILKLSGPPGYYSEPKQLALLRRARRGPHDQLLLDFSGPDVLMELTAAGRVLWTSRWDWQATIDRQPFAPTGPWREVCWHSDSDVDYLEIEQPLAGGWNIQRQAVLGRKDRFLLLADALLGPRPREGEARESEARESEAAEMKKRAEPQPRPLVGALEPARPLVAAMCASEIRYAATIALGDKVQFAPAAETREGWLACGRQRCATIVPLALPEWRAERGHSDFASAADNTLVLMQAAQGHALYAPLWIDLDPRHTRQPVTWRRLTVAENLQVMPRDVAVGYRVQIGRGQWLTYRTLAPRGNRTVLGQNYSADFVCSRLIPNGLTEGIIEIQ